MAEVLSLTLGGAVGVVGDLPPCAIVEQRKLVCWGVDFFEFTEAGQAFSLVGLCGGPYLIGEKSAFEVRCCCCFMLIHGEE